MNFLKSDNSHLCFVWFLFKNHTISITDRTGVQITKLSRYYLFRVSFFSTWKKKRFIIDQNAAEQPAVLVSRQYNPISCHTSGFRDFFHSSCSVFSDNCKRRRLYHRESLGKYNREFRIMEMGAIYNLMGGCVFKNPVLNSVRTRNFFWIQTAL